MSFFNKIKVNITTVSSNYFLIFAHCASKGVGLWITSLLCFETGSLNAFFLIIYYCYSSLLKGGEEIINRFLCHNCVWRKKHVWYWIIAFFLYLFPVRLALAKYSFLARKKNLFENLSWTVENSQCVKTLFFLHKCVALFDCKYDVGIPYSIFVALVHFF